MNNKLMVKQSVLINAPISKVWNALFDPEMIRQYLFGTTVISDWKEGSKITYKGIWNGAEYEDKGTILKIETEKVLETTYWSSMSGTADSPENYKKITYKVKTEINGTQLIITQDNNATEEEKNHSEENWKSVLNKLKEILEK